MSSKVDFFLNKTLGQGFVESLAKTELWKPSTKSVNDIDDMLIGLKIVPRAIMSFLVKELAPMAIGDNKEIQIPVEGTYILKVTKVERDQYHGDIREGSKIIVDLKYRSIPGIGLVIMSAFELYPTDGFAEEKETQDLDIDAKVQKLVDERLALHDLIGKVVDKKIEEKEAIKQLIIHKINQPPKIHTTILPTVSEKDKELKKEAKQEKRISKFREFMERKKKPSEFSVEMAKNEKIYCPDCGKNIYNGTLYSGCVCFGDTGKVYIKKSEHGIKVRFGRNWDIENIEMLLSVLRKKYE